MTNKQFNKNIYIFIIISVFASAIIGGYIGTRLAASPSIEISAPLNKPTYIAGRITSSVVTVRARIPVRGLSGQMQQRIGCGVIFNQEGYIVTNYHLVSSAKEIFIKAFNKDEVPAKIIGSSKENDLAVLKVNLSNLFVPKFGQSKKIKLGEQVIAIGKPFLTTDNYTVTSGIISALPTNLPKNSPVLLQTDATINPGNSGGPIVNMKGEIIGITTAYLSTGDNASGIGFAIPIDEAKRIINDIIKNN